MGNNIVGDEAGQHIAEFIRSGKSPLTIWYIAGNNLTVDGISPICEALKDDKQVTALWLKRNPLKAAGMRPIADLLSVNHTIQVLDLLNCGLLDAGVRVLFDSLDENNSLKHLYLSANGITPVGLESIVEFYRLDKSNLETLFLGCNRIENKGAEMLAEILKIDTKLIRFNAASSRIGADGMRAIAEALRSHPSLMVLDMGYTRATMDLGELGNFIEDEGAIYLAHLIGHSKKLISVNITHNHITQQGMQFIVDALEFNKSLLHFDYVQFGTSLNEIMLSEMRIYLNRNRRILNESQPDFDPDTVLIPEHVKQIYSVYRTR